MTLAIFQDKLTYLQLFCYKTANFCSNFAKRNSLLATEANFCLYHSLTFPCQISNFLEWTVVHGGKCRSLQCKQNIARVSADVTFLGIRNSQSRNLFKICKVSRIYRKMFREMSGHNKSKQHVTSLPPISCSKFQWFCGRWGGVGAIFFKCSSTPISRLSFLPGAVAVGTNLRFLSVTDTVTRSVFWIFWVFKTSAEMKERIFLAFCAFLMASDSVASSAECPFRFKRASKSEIDELWDLMSHRYKDSLFTKGADEETKIRDR